MWDMLEWKEAVEHCFFTDCLDKHLKDFLSSQKPMLSDEELWNFLYATVSVWMKNYLIDSCNIMLPSFFQQWNIGITLTKFSIPEPMQYTLEEALYWTILTGWTIDRENGEEWSYICPCLDLEWRLRDFQYLRENCVWLNKRQFLEEMGNIYNRSQEVFQYYQEQPNDDYSPWVCGMEEDCSEFLNHYVFFKKHLNSPEIVRLNRFEPNEYVWYLIREDFTLHFLLLGDFG